MDVTVSQQSTVFLHCILCGVALGIAFDVFRILRRMVKSSNPATHVEDILYWLVASLIAFSFVLHTNDGEIRWYMLAGVILGGYFYAITISRLVVGVAVWILQWLERILLWVVKTLSLPICFLLRLLKRPFFLVVRLGRRGGRQIKSKLYVDFLFFRKFSKKV